MRQIILFVTSLLVTADSLCQNFILRLEKREIIAGENHLTHKPIPGIQYKFPYLIYSSYLQNQRVTFLLRSIDNKGEYYKDEGYLAVFDLEKESLIWEKEVKTFDVKQDSNILIQIRPNRSYLVPNRSYRLSNETGREIWETESLVRSIHFKQGIAIGFEYRNPGFGASNKLNGINVADGTVRWSRKISSEFGVNESIYLNDSTLLMAASGLHSVNIATGKGWDYEVLTGTRDYRKNMGRNAISLAVNALTGIATPIVIGHEVVSGITSNIYLKNAHIYFASYDELVCLGNDGNIIWKSPFKDVMGKSSLFVENQILYLLNSGYGYFRNQIVESGEPFISAYDLQTGKLLFQKFLVNKQIINAFQIQNNSLLLISNDRISKYFLQNGEQLAENVIDTKDFGPLRSFLNSQVYSQLKDSTLSSITNSDSSKSFISTKFNKILSFNRNLEMDSQITSYDSCFSEYLKFKDLTLFWHNGETVVINRSNKIVSHLNVSRKSRIIGSKLYDTQRDALLIIDLNDIIKPIQK